MKNNELAKFEYNGKTYVYYNEINNPDSVKYGVLENGNIIETTDPKDIQIMNEASKKIFVSSNPKNHIKLGTMIYHGKKFQQMFDEQSELKFFYEIKDEKYYMPSNEDALALFEMFNLHDLYISNNSNDEYYENIFSDPDSKTPKKKKEDPTKKIIKGLMIFGVSTLAVITISAGLLRTNAIEEVFRPNYETTQTENVYNEEYLVKALKMNQNLSHGEKQVFKDQFEFVMKYADYTDFEELGNRLERVYSEYIDGPKEGDADCAADYSRKNVRIRDFYSRGFDSNDKSDFGHEVGHCCASPLCDNSGISEATTEIVASEHEYARDITSYGEIIAFQKVMYEIIGQDPFGRYQQSGDIKHIINPLISIIDDQYLAYQLTTCLDNVLVYGRISNNYDGKFTKEEEQEAKKNYEENNKVIIETLSKYFYIVKGYPMEEDLIVKLLLTSANILQDKFSFSFDSGSYELNPYEYYIKKGYFLDDYKNKYSDYTVLVPFSHNGGLIYTGIVINESNRRVDPNSDVYYIGDTVFTEGENKKRIVESTEGKVVSAAESSQESEANQNTYSNGGVVKYTFFGHGLYEAAEEIAKRENIYEGGSKIPQYRIEQATYFKILYEILGKDTMQKFYETKDVNIVINALTNVTSNEEEAKALIYDIDSISNNYYILNSDPNNNDSLGILKNMGNTIRGKLNRYFEMVYGYSASEDALISFYYLELQSEIDSYGNSDKYINVKEDTKEETIIGPSDNKKISVTKALLDSNYIELFPNTTAHIFFPDQEKTIYIYIDENNRKMNLETNDDKTNVYYFDEGIDKEK